MDRGYIKKLRGGLTVVTPGFEPGNEGSIPSPAATLCVVLSDRDTLTSPWVTIRQ